MSRYGLLLVLFLLGVAMLIVSPTRLIGAEADGGLYVGKDSWPETMAASRARYLEWLEAKSASVVEVGVWHATGPLAARNLSDVFFPEEGIDLEAKDSEGKSLWRKRPEWADGKVHGLPLKTNASTYLYRTITVNRPSPVSVSLGSDDGLEVWLNGKKILSKDVARGVAANQDTAPLSLVAGENALLMKVHNRGGAHGFYFNIEGGPVANLLSMMKGAYPAEFEAMSRDLSAKKVQSWFGKRVSAGLEKELVGAVLRTASDKALQAEYDEFSQAGVPAGDARWLDLYWRSCGHRQKVRRIREAYGAVNMAALRRGIEDLIRSFPERYGDGADYLARLAGFEERYAKVEENLDGEGSIKLAEELVAFQRETLLSNPLLDFDKLLVLRRRFGGGARNVMGGAMGTPGLNAHTNDDIPHKGWDNELAVLSNLRGEQKMRSLFRPAEGKVLRDTDVDFDGERIMFSSIGANDRWALFEINKDGSGLRQLTPTDLPDVDFFDSCYLPDKRIVVCSTASYQGLPCEGGGRPMVNLYLLDPKDSSIRQLTFEQDSNYHPCVLPNGRILYLRWEYADLPHYYSRILFHCNPDGTNQMEYWGSGSFFPTAFKHARPLPGHPRKVIGVMGGHHSVAESGRMAIIDPSLARKYPLRHDPESKEWGPPGSQINIHGEVLPAAQTGFVQEIPGYGKDVVGNIYDGQGDEPFPLGTPHFVYPYPLSENYFLVSAKPKRSSLWGIYLVDVFDNMTLIREEEGVALFEPFPFVPRERPPVIPDRVNDEKKTATVYITDIYSGPGVAGIPRGVVKSLRIFAYHFAYNQRGGHDVLGVESSWDIKRILGTVPVEPDGSAFFTVPANTPVSLQPLDNEGRALQLMRSWLVGKPGENVSCGGCHEQQNQASANLATTAARRDPDEIKPFYGAVRPFGYEFEMQPVVEKYCVGCHDGATEVNGKKGLAFRNAPESYRNLHPYVRRPGPESDLAMLRPMEYHASTSLLMQMLEKGHYNVNLDAEARERIYCWIDLNAPYQAKWSPANWRGQEQAARRCELAAKYAGLDDNPETEYAEAARAYAARAKVEPIVPEQSRVGPAAPLSAKGWPFGQDRAKEMQANSPIGDSKVLELGKRKSGQPLQLRLQPVPAGTFVMGAVDSYLDESAQAIVEIEEPFWMSENEITNEVYGLFDPEHDTRYYDEHGKDQATPGYIGNHRDQPVARVSWIEATAFCKWLGEKTGMRVTLPTEAQWEWAARAGSDARFYYGELDAQFSGVANLSDKTRLFTKTGWDGGSVVHRRRSYDPNHHFPLRDDGSDDGSMVANYVGQYGANVWGLRDMVGNVCEWTRTSYRPYPYRDDDGRNDGDGAARKVARGGSWHDRPRTAGSSIRFAYEPYQKVFNVGFRVIVEPKELVGVRDASGEGRLANAGAK
ncbi:SUMF1/EgtB/PvdO family nonheme iron enzyme [Candidatus Sumerlaeota bacterium]